MQCHDMLKSPREEHPHRCWQELGDAVLIAERTNFLTGHVLAHCNQVMVQVQIV